MLQSKILIDVSAALEEIDVADIEEWAKRLGVQDLWQEVRSRALPDDGSLQG